jgi:NAD(P)-dependent dehydrogenase (short-subunit alcohol dehydrogenase family)
MLWVMITGTSRGLGRALAEVYLEKGHSVVGVSRTASECQHPNFYWRHASLASSISYGSVYKSLPQFDRVILNAGVNDRESLTQWTKLSCAFHLKTNCTGHIDLVSELTNADHLSEKCRLVGMGSILEHGSDRFPAYALSKAALGSYVRSVAKVWARVGSMRSVVIYPGRVDTPGNPKRDGDGISFRSSEEVARDIYNLVESDDLENGRTYDLPEHLGLL